MARILEKDLLAGALLAEVVRQHLEIRLSPVFVDAVLIVADDICEMFDIETLFPEKKYTATHCLKSVSLPGCILHSVMLNLTTIQPAATKL